MQIQKMALGSLLALCASANAAPMMGTTQSFATSSFCKTYDCRLEEKRLVSPGTVDWRYSLGPQFPQYSSLRLETVIIRRVNQRIVSANYVTLAQDYVFWPDSIDSYGTKLAATLVSLLTGKKPSGIYLASLNRACDGNPKLQTLPWNVAGKTFSLSCRMDSETYERAWAFRFFVTNP